MRSRPQPAAHHPAAAAAPLLRRRSGALVDLVAPRHGRGCSRLAAIGLPPSAPTAPITDPYRAFGLAESICDDMARDETSASLTAAAGTAWNLLAQLAAERDGCSYAREPIALVQTYLREHLASPTSVPALAELAVSAPHTLRSLPLAHRLFRHRVHQATPHGPCLPALDHKRPHRGRDRRRGGLPRSVLLLAAVQRSERCQSPRIPGLRV